MRLPDKTVGHPAPTLLSQEWPFPCLSFSLVSFLRALAQKCSHEEPCFCSRPQKHMWGSGGHSPCPDAQTPAAQRYLPSIDSFALCRDVLINTQGTKEYRYVVFILRTSLFFLKDMASINTQFCNAKARGQTQISCSGKPSLP